uniref:Uncharacterized protein n=1 Tax=Panagrolaimus superbus TaxID=310955 RepID=A0A914YRH0_9BILA
MEKDVVPVSIKRIGAALTGKTRIIALELKSKADRNKLLKNAREVIKADAKLSNAKVFFNKSLPKNEQSIQYALRKEMKEQRTKGISCKISNNQLIDTVSSFTISCEANDKAKEYYDHLYSFRPRGISTASSVFGFSR